jgi:hypothetical protein
MKTSVYTSIPPALAGRLARFEAEFTYPLGNDDSFRIEHGPDYLSFYRSLGDAFCVVAGDERRIGATVSATLRTLTQGSHQCVPVWYIGDLKIASSYRGSGLLEAVSGVAVSHAVHRAQAAIAVVMDGTSKRPEDYAVHAGVPGLTAIQRLRLRTIPIDDHPVREGFSIGVTSWGDPRGLAEFRRLSPNVAYFEGDTFDFRSLYQPVWIAATDVAAVGRLEDTLATKRLVRSDGTTRRTAHLAHFAAHNVNAAQEVLRNAYEIARSRGFEELMVSLPEASAVALETAFTALGATDAAATVYALKHPGDTPIHINSSEI